MKVVKLTAALNAIALGGWTLLLCASCVHLPTTPAPWDASPTAIRQIFPDGEYIAQRGRGKTRAAAEADGAAQISLFFNTQISSQILITERSSERNGNAQSSTEFESETFVQSQMNLFGIRYAQDAYFDASQKEWVTVAYIDRSEAWQIYGQRFNQQARAFHQLFLAAENETDPFRKALRFIAAQNYARLPDFQNADVLGQLLYPSKMNEEFAFVRADMAALPQRLDNARRNATVFIDCPVDFESLISNAFLREFAALGFPAANTRASSAAVCRITVTEGMQQRELGIFYNPSLQAVVSSPSGTLFTFSAEGERASAVTPDVAKRRAYQSLAQQVEKFRLELSAQLPE